MSAVPIALEDAGKRYVKYQDSPMLVTAALRFRSRTKRTKLWAIRHVDLSVPAGECVGVIGRNGSGKSTLLQMVAGCTSPTEGVVRVYGRVAPLISVGVGFHQELTGRENVFVNGTILGLTRRQIEQRLDEILAFADIGSFVDTPVKFYSSGMVVRLGFSVAIHSDPEVLLVDEVLAVGDLAFQFKCLERMMEIRRSGATILVVSHNLNAVRKLCDRTLVLHLGEPRFDGPTGDAISLYHEVIDELREIEDELDPTPDLNPERRGVLSIVNARVLGPDRRPTGHVQAGDQVTFQVEVQFDRSITDPMVGLVITDDRGTNVYAESSLTRPVGRFEAGEQVVIDMPVDISLVTGSYSCRVSITDPVDKSTRLGRSRRLDFYVSGRKMVTGVVDLGAEFIVTRLADEGDAASAGG